MTTRDRADLGAGSEQPLVVPWCFPAQAPHDGIPLGNGVFGAMVWGAEDRIRITINSAALRDSPDALPVGRIDFALPDGELTLGALDLHKAEGSLRFDRKGGGSDTIQAVVLQDRPVLVVHFPQAGGVQIKPVPAWEGDWDQSAPEHFEEAGNGSPVLFRQGDSVGWTVERPDEGALAVVCRKHFRPGTGTAFLITATRAEQPEEAVDRAMRDLEEVRPRIPVLLAGTEMWWRRYWEEGAHLRVPDLELQRLYYLGMYKAACVAMEQRHDASLQGPWAEVPTGLGDFDRLAACFWPVFGGNHPDLAHSLFRLMEGGWPGQADPEAAIRAGHLVWLYWRYTRDERFLREFAYPFLRGVCEEMLERDGDLSAGDSYQLAAVHFLGRALLESIAQLGVEDDRAETWRSVISQLSLYSLTPDGQEIALRDGQPLAESHPDHSHLAGIYPLTIFSPKEGDESAILRASLRAWVEKGMARWTGWSFPWAAILHARAGSGDAAEALLQLFARAFVSDGYATLHDARFEGLTTCTGRPGVTRVETAITRVETAMAFAAAMQEMLLHADAGKLWLFPAMPRRWQEVEFSQMRAEGAFIVSGRWRNGRLHSATVESRRGGLLHLRLPATPRLVRHCEGALETRLPVSGPDIVIETSAGDLVEIMA